MFQEAPSEKKEEKHSNAKSGIPKDTELLSWDEFQQYFPSHDPHLHDPRHWPTMDPPST